MSDNWFVQHNKEIYGPFHWQIIKNFLHQNLEGSLLLRRENSEKWLSASRVYPFYRIVKGDGEWLLALGETTEGPFSENEVKNLLFEKAIDENTLAWHAGMNSWTPVGEISFFSLDLHTNNGFSEPKLNQNDRGRDFVDEETTVDTRALQKEKASYIPYHEIRFNPNTSSTISHASNRQTANQLTLKENRPATSTEKQGEYNLISFLSFFCLASFIGFVVAFVVSAVISGFLQEHQRFSLDPATRQLFDAVKEICDKDPFCKKDIPFNFFGLITGLFSFSITLFATRSFWGPVHPPTSAKERAFPTKIQELAWVCPAFLQEAKNHRCTLAGFSSELNGYLFVLCVLSSFLFSAAMTASMTFFFNGNLKEMNIVSFSFCFFFYGIFMYIFMFFLFQDYSC